MADIFISYVHSDRERVEPLVEALEASGFSIWWDRHIDAGAEFSKDIERELDSAKAVIVAWSAAGRESPWVRDEASHAMKQGKLVPVQLDENGPPLGFQQYQVIDLTHWRGKADEEAFRALCASLEIRVKDGPSAGQDTATINRAAAGSARPPSTSFLATPLARVIGGAVFAVALVAIGLTSFLGGDEVIEVNEVAGQEAAPGQSVLQNLPSATEGIGLAVLPFVNMSSDPEQEYFADGLSEELLNWLGNVEGLRVPGRTSSFVFKGKLDDLRLIGEKLNVQYLLEGSVRRSGDKLRITAQLIEARTGYHLWSETYDRKPMIFLKFRTRLRVSLLSKPLARFPMAA